MADSTPPTIVQRFFRACLLILGGIAALWLALDLLSQFWGWVVLIIAIALVLWCLVIIYRYWWGGR